MEKEKKKLNILGIILVIAATTYALAYLVTIPAAYYKSDMFTFIISAYNKKDYFSLVLFILTTINSLLQSFIILFWTAYLIWKKEPGIAPIICSIIFILLRFSHTIINNIRTQDLFSKYEIPNYLFAILSLVLWIMLLIKRNVVTRIIFFIGGLVFWLKSIPSIAKFIISCITKLNLLTIRGTETNLVIIALYICQLIVFFLFLLFILLPEIFKRKLPEEAEE